MRVSRKYVVYTNTEKFGKFAVNYIFKAANKRPNDLKVSNGDSK